MSGVRLLTQPSVSAISLEDAKAHLRVTSTTEDSVIQELLAVAASEVEARTCRVLLESTFALYLDRFPDSAPIVLPRAPLIAVDSIKYLDGDGVEQTLAAEDYMVELRREPGRVHPWLSWPATQASRPDAVTITFRAGYANPDAIPAALKHAIRLYVADVYLNRSATEVLEGSGRVLENPAFAALLAGQRIVEFA